MTFPALVAAIATLDGCHFSMVMACALLYLTSRVLTRISVTQATQTEILRQILSRLDQHTQSTSQSHEG
jgi:hypothetical protein